MSPTTEEVLKYVYNYTDGLEERCIVRWSTTCRQQEREREKSKGQSRRRTDLRQGFRDWRDRNVRILPSGVIDNSAAESNAADQEEETTRCARKSRTEPMNDAMLCEYGGAAADQSRRRR